MTSTPISLYLDLEKGEKADLEVVARASLAFVAAIRDVAAMLDPSLEVRVELASGTEGSLSLNSIIKTLGTKITDKKVLAAVALTILVYFRDEIRDHVVDKVMDAFIPGFSDEHFSPEEKKTSTTSFKMPLRTDLVSRRFKTSIARLGGITQCEASAPRPRRVFDQTRLFQEQSFRAGQL